MKPGLNKRPTLSRIWAAGTSFQESGFSSHQEHNHEDSSESSSDDDSLSRAVKTMKIRRNKQRKLVIEVVVDLGELNIISPAAARARPSSAPGSRSSQSSTDNRHYTQSIAAGAPPCFPTSKKTFSFSMYISNELTWKRLAQVAASRYGACAVTGAGQKTDVRPEGDFIPINVSTVGPGKQDDFHHPNHSVLLGEYAVEEASYDDDGNELNAFSSTQNSLIDHPSHEFNNISKQTKPTNQPPLSTKQKKTITTNISKPSQYEPPLTQNPFTVKNLNKIKKSNKYGSSLSNSNPYIKQRSKNMKWRTSVVTLEEDLEEQRQKRAELLSNIKPPKETHPKERNITFHGLDEEDDDDCLKTKRNSQKRSGKISNDDKTLLGKNKVTDDGKIIGKRNEVEGKVDVWITVALGIMVEKQQVVLPRWHSIAFFVSKGQRNRKQRALELELACQAQFRAHNERPYTDSISKWSAVTQLMSRHLPSTFIPKAAQDSLVDSATWMIPVPSERQAVMATLSDYLPQLAELFSSYGSIVEGHTYLPFGDFKELIAQAFGARQDAGWEAMVSLLYKRSNVLVRSHATDVVGVNAPALLQAGGLFLFGHYKDMRSNSTMSKLSAAIKTSKKSSHSKVQVEENYQSVIEDEPELLKTKVEELNRTQILLDAHLHKHRHYHKHDVFHEMLQVSGSKLPEKTIPNHRKTTIHPPHPAHHHHQSHPNHRDHHHKHHNSSSPSNMNHPYSILHEKEKHPDLMDSEEKKRQQDIARVMERRLFDDRPFRSTRTDTQDESPPDMMEFPEFLWAVWNLATIWGVPNEDNVGGSCFNPFLDDDDTIQSQTTHSIYSFSTQEAPFVAKSILELSHSEASMTGTDNSTSLLDTSVVTASQFDVFGAAGSTKRYTNMESSLRGVLVKHLLPVLTLTSLEPMVSFVLHQETTLALLQTNLEALRRVFHTYTVMDSEIAAQNSINEEESMQEEKKKKKKLRSKLAIMEAEKEAAKLAEKQKFEDETMSLAEFSMVCHNTKLVSESKAKTLFEVSTNLVGCSTNQNLEEFHPRSIDKFLEKYFQTVLLNPLNRRVSSSYIARTPSSAAFSPTTRNHADDPFEVVVGEHQEQKEEPVLDLPDFLEALCRLAVWEGHHSDPVKPIEQKVERCLFQVVSLDGVKRSAADASVTRSKVLAQRRSTRNQQNNTPSFGDNLGSTMPHQQPMHQPMRQQHQKIHGTGDNVHLPINNFENNGGDVVQSFVGEDNISEDNSLSSSTKLKLAALRTFSQSRRQHTETRSESKRPEAFDLKKSRRRSFYFD